MADWDGFILTIFILVCYYYCVWAVPITQDASFVREKRQATTHPPKIRNEVAAFIESGLMNNDYVWVDVTTRKFVAIPGNNLEFGNCTDDDELIYFDNTVIENSGPSTLNGTLEIYIDSPVNISCVRAIDQIQDGSGGIPTFNSMGTNWAKIDVAGQYGRGFHFHIYVYGIRARKVGSPEKEKESKDAQSNLV
ncbi:uncharacterized protein LOC129739234 [Uranotaenia lowii]|uniref:uncharacterized protein LOC129739234 n=1 Tax=Uranotaenia lowii TaxID=190385 RepID=UPI0024783335|nr:uncharacterized protein LOC129739234 [Uranotaenia lowii]